MNHPINATELALKIYHKFPAVWNSIPIVSVNGENKTFGTIVFKFEEDEEEIVINAWLFDKNKIEVMAKIAVDDFSDLINDHYSVMMR
jgi:hypothetical protein